jgi:hypothetical protein
MLSDPEKYMADERSTFYDEVVNKGLFVESGYDFAERTYPNFFIEDWSKNAWYY